MKRGLKAGWHTAVILVDNRDPAEALELSINSRLDQIQADAYGAGYNVDVKSVTVSGAGSERAGYGDLYAIILYRLDEDPSFHPPM